MKTNLIYDVGMHNGDDTAYYLHRGYEVVAVEADPDLAEEGRHRFAQEIAEGRLKIENCAIAEQEGEADFFICESKRIWNSFDKDSASREGRSCQAVKVRTRPLRHLLLEHGVPFYLKLDIEGFDQLAASDISIEDAPAYISMEVGSVDDFYLLRAKGYQEFKCIQQGCFQQVTSPRLSLASAMRAKVVQIKSSPFANRIRTAYQKWRRPSAAVASQTDWRFDPGSSGPFGEETPGPWMTFEEALHAWLSVQIGHQLGYRVHPPGISQWFDLHARRHQIDRKTEP